MIDEDDDYCMNQINYDGHYILYIIQTDLPLY